MNPCFASQLRGRAQTVEELVRLGTQIERDYYHQRKYNQLQLSKSTTFDQNSQARKIRGRNKSYLAFRATKPKFVVLEVS